MGRICYITAAILLLTVSWIWAGTFDDLAAASAARTTPPVFAAAGMVVKTEFKSGAQDDSEMQTESDTLLPEPASAVGAPQAIPQPAAAYKKRSNRGMSPPPKRQSASSLRSDAVAQKKEDPSSLDLDLEKDLVISPPPARTDETLEESDQPGIETRGAPGKEAVQGKTVDKKKSRIEIRRVSPPAPEQHAAKAIRKVRPLTQDPWSIPAGSHGNRSYPTVTEPLAPESYGRMAPPAMPRRYVRDGVTIKLAPTDAPAARYPEYDPEREGESDILSTATEIIGMPFAFISSLF
jgi:hypothetical protein